MTQLKVNHIISKCDDNLDPKAKDGLYFRFHGVQYIFQG